MSFRLAACAAVAAIVAMPGSASAQVLMQRDVSLRTQVYTGLLQSLEDAKAREVRSTPVITMFEKPQMPVVGDSRGSIQRAFLGVVIGGLLGLLIAFAGDAIIGARRASSPDAQEFFTLLNELKPSFLRR